MTVLAGTGLPHNGIVIRLPPTMPTGPPELTWILRSLFPCHCMPPTADGGDTITGYRFPRKRGSEEAANGGDDNRAAGGDGGSAPYRRRAAGGGRMGGRCAPRHLAQAGSNAGDIGRPADEIRRKAVMFSSFHLSLHRCPGGRPAHGGISSEVSRQYPAIAQRRTTLRRQCAGLPGAAASRKVDSLRFPKHR